MEKIYIFKADNICKVIKNITKMVL